MANPTKHKATSNSISRNNDRNQKSSLKCKIQQDMAHSPLQLRPRMYRHVLQSHNLIQHPSLRQASTVHRWGQISNIHSTLFTLHPEPRISEPSVNFFSESVRRSVPNRPQLSATGYFSAGFHLLLPCWTLISVKKATYVQVYRCLARWKI